ncbi:hypothetical protein Csp2054_05185 [Curtobacterium sp. 'Ferrero']|nr:hypothetical protein Csp2054_05185 [Curtobacterium sp. 'Ferrero']
MKKQKWNFTGFGVGAAAGTIGIIVMIHILERATATPLAVVSVAAGIVALFGALLRVTAHFYGGPRSKGVDMAGKTLALCAALQLTLLGLFELGLLGA